MSGRIVGGEEAVRHEFPWQVLIVSTGRRGQSAPSYFKCGGNKINCLKNNFCIYLNKISNSKCFRNSHKQPICTHCCPLFSEFPANKKRCVCWLRCRRYFFKVLRSPC